MATYRLGSSPNISAPGMVAWAINGAAFAKDVPTMVSIIAGSWHIPDAAAHALVTKQVPFTLDGETVVFDHSEVGK